MLASPAAEFPNDNPALHDGTIWVNRAPCGPLEAEAHAARELEDVVVAALTETAAPPEVIEPTILEHAPVAEPEPMPEIAAEVAAEVVAEIAAEVAAEVVVEIAAAQHPPLAVEMPEPLPEPAPTRHEPPPPLESLIVLSAAPRDEIEPPLVDEEIVVEELDFDLSSVPIETAAPPHPPPAELPPPAQDDAYVALVRTLGEIAVAEGGTAEAVAALLEGAEQTTARAWRAVLRGEVDDISTCGSAMLDEWCASVVATAIGAPARATALRRELRNRGVCAFGLIEAA